MRTYVLRRLLQLVPLLLAVVVLTFALLKAAPGDYVTTVAADPQVPTATLEAMRHRFGLDRPWPEQLGLYVWNLAVRFDLGESFSHHRPVADVLRTGLLSTLLLALAAALLTWGLAVPLGAWAAARQGRAVDRAVSGLAFAGLAVPEVVSALLLLMLAARTGWFPVGGMRSLDWENLGPVARGLDVLRHLALPAVVVALVPLAGRVRQMRASLLDVLRLDYVTTARAKGLDEGAVVMKHALRNALNPMITLFGYTLGSLLSGSLVAEIVFAWPGLGRVAYEAVLARDQYLVAGSVLMAATLLVLGNLVADVLLAWADPRIRRA
jgi:peptide/nickel transport system permease protein